MKEFEFETGLLDDPTDDGRFARLVDIGYLANTTTPTEIVRTLQMTPICNDDREFNCQSWIEEALRRLRNAGEISTQQYEDGFDHMMDAVAEARDAR